MLYLALAPLPALADDITITVTTATGATTQTWTMPAADSAEFEKWTAQAYGCMVVPPASACTALTQAESNAAWAQATLQGTIDNVTRYRQLEAAKDAVAGVPTNHSR